MDWDKQKIDVSVALFTGVAALAAVVAAIVAWQAAGSADRTNIKGQLVTQISQYLQEYSRLYHDTPDPFNVIPYSSLTIDKKIQAQVVGGLLVGVVDLMFEADDERAKTWSTYFAGMPSLLLCGDSLQIYARMEQTKSAISIAKSNAIRLGRACPSPSAKPS